MTKYTFNLTIDTNNLDLALAEIESWLNDMKYNLSDESEDYLITDFNLEQYFDLTEGLKK